jgi:hypothetical protein
MTPEQYWDSDPTLTKYYREAEEKRIERRNQEFWLQGMYIYEAICDVSPILHAFAKKGAKPHPYSDKPYSITEKQRRQEEEIRHKKLVEKGKRFMEAVMKANNKKYEGDVPTQ